jgi:hypothetical protein
MVTMATENPVRSWYVTGIVLLSEWRRTRATRCLYEWGISSWLTEAKIAFPCDILALASSQDGENVLKRFHFFIEREAGDMPDGFSLYRIHVGSRTDFLNRIRPAGVLVAG